MASTEVVTLARRLRAARALSGLTVDELAQAVGVSKRTYWRLEAGDRTPDALELQRIAGATGQPLEFFLAASQVEEPNLNLMPGAVKPDG